LLFLLMCSAALLFGLFISNMTSMLYMWWPYYCNALICCKMVIESILCTKHVRPGLFLNKVY
jgi:hypothetical protein